MRLAQENPPRGYQPIHGELKKLGLVREDRDRDAPGVLVSEAPERHAEKPTHHQAKEGQAISRLPL
jgi:hypothetical protein